MIKLNSDTFRRAIEKAKTLQPACDLKFTDENRYTFQVQSACPTSGPYTVDIWHQGGTLWTSCDCAAGAGLYRRGFPQPCYHVATAALSFGLFTQTLPVGAVLDLAPEGAASRQVPAPLIDVRELAPIPALVPCSAPQLPAWRISLGKVGRWLGRVFWFARESRA